MPPAHGRRQREQQGAAAGAHSAASRRLEARRREGESEAVEPPHLKAAEVQLARGREVPRENGADRLLVEEEAPAFALQPRGAKGLGASFQNEFDYNDDSAYGGVGGGRGGARGDSASSSVDGDDLPPRADEGELAAAVRFAAHAAAMSEADALAAREAARDLPPRPSGGGYSSLMARGVAGATSGVAAVRRSVDAGAPRQRAPKKPVWKRDPVPLTLMQL
ncbi:hypothetical protein T492DRAFT_115457 [Pavlovales sp. CCMP2436]|nr:hypothetical protein T492DRAFT_115457 [Pavlovales sp. CCMP2436]